MEKLIKDSFNGEDAKCILEAVTKAGFTAIEQIKEYSREDIKDELRSSGLTGPKLLSFLKLLDKKGSDLMRGSRSKIEPLYQQLVKPKDPRELEIRRFIPDEESRGFNSLIAKTIILLGETGVGKSTLIDAMVNHLLGVRQSDDYRYKAVVDPPKKSRVESQTTDPTAYTLINYGIGFSVKIIDTPGFGDTKGIEADRVNKERIHKYLKALDRIDLVCFVLKSNETRLTPVQLYIIGEVLTMFGKDAINNIVMMFTFSDGGSPQSAIAMTEEKVPYKQQFKFNNSALFANRLCDFAQMETYWEIGRTSMEEFLGYLRVAEGFSLTMTKEVIKERERLNCIMESILPNLDCQLRIKCNIEETKRKIEVDRKIIDETQHYEEDHVVERLVTSPCKPGCFTTYCETCKITCHRECAIQKKENKNDCVAMNNGLCGVCPGKCHYMNHLHYDKIVELKPIVERIELEAKKSAHIAASEEKRLSDVLLEAKVKALADVEEKISKSINDLKDCKIKLTKTALKEYNMSANDYISLLILRETTEAKEGYEARISCLMAFKKKNELLGSIKVDH